MREQVLPPSWGYDALSLVDSEGRPRIHLNRPDLIDPFSFNNDGRMKPIWKILPREESDWTMDNIQRALEGEPVHSFRSIDLQGHKIKGEMKIFDLGKGLVALLARHELDGPSTSMTPPTEFDALSRYYLLRGGLQLPDPEEVWWVQDTGFISNHRVRWEMTPPFAISPGQRIHLREVCHPDSAQGIMNCISEVSETHQQQSFTMEESGENFKMVNAYTIYPLTTVWSIEHAVAMVTKSCIFTDISNALKIIPVA